MRLVHATGEQEGLIDTRFALVHGDPVFQRGGIADDAGREMRHHRIAIARKARGGGDHLLDGCAFDMGDVDARACGQQVAEILDLFGGARHHLDRIALEECLNLRADRAGGAGVVSFLRKFKSDMIGSQRRIRGSRPSIVGDQGLEAVLIIFRVDTGGFGRGDIGGVSVDREGRGLAPFGEIGVGLGRAHLHRRAIDRLFETLGQGHLAAPAALADDDLCGDVPPIDDCDIVMDDSLSLGDPLNRES